MRMEKLSEVLEKVLSERDQVEAAYIFGSIAEGKEHEDSDIDIALLLEKPSEEMIELDVASDISERVGRSREIDVRVMNGRDIRFTHQVLKNGERIYTRDQEAATRFEEDFYRKYLDMKPFIEEHDRIRMERLRS